MQQILIIKDKSDATVEAMGFNFIIGPEEGPIRVILHKEAARELVDNLSRLLTLDVHAQALGAFAEAMDKRLEQLSKIQPQEESCSDAKR